MTSNTETDVYTTTGRVAHSSLSTLEEIQGRTPPHPPEGTSNEVVVFFSRGPYCQVRRQAGQELPPV